MFTEKTIQKAIKEKIGDDLFVVVSNREPYMHIWREGKVIVNKPASGLVTAMDPMLRASHGLWVAHGAGNADRKVVDGNDCVPVPPGEDLYTLKRVWLSKEEERGYYLGFANGTLWPLCHVAFARPTFDVHDWEMYRRVNQRFADAILDEVGDRRAFIWVQDFHFALLPRMLKEKRPDLMVAHFWHIPWPNPEIFRICPWVREILEGLLGSDLIGFHIQMHADNFLNTVDQSIEVRIDRERSTIYHHGGVGTKVLPFPISVDFEQIGKDAQQDFTDNEVVRAATEALPETYSIMAIGVDRLDYTKGIPERLRAIDRFLEKYPQMIEQFIFVQLGALSRIRIRLYKDLNDEINSLVDDINWRYATDSWQPIVLLRRNLTYPEVLALYRMAQICVVSSVHDGMNLVAKEFVSSKTDEDGVLLLSQFTGAARELEEGAIIFNPFDREQFADALFAASTMTEEECRERMKRMREVVAEHNIYRWGENFIEQLARLA